VHVPTAVATFLFTDIEGSTRLWEQEPERMRTALARHDALARASVEAHRGILVKTMGDGVHAVFDDALDAVRATLALQQALADPTATGGLPLRVRCGLHLGTVERRDNDYFGTPVNRTARIMAAAHGGQMLVSKAVADAIGSRLPDGVSLRDLGAVRLRDLTSPEHVYQIVHPDLRRDFPALRSLESTPNNLPQQVTSFIGRERELAEVKALLGRTRLLTLLGVGGLGKTRLSLQAAVEVIDDYPDGAWFVELAPLADPRLAAQAVASVLGVKEDAGRPVSEALANFCRDRRLLLILDNCEHLIQACAELAAGLLRTAAHVTILASSREALHVPGETSYQVPPLAAPDPQRPATPGALVQFEAVRLFVDRAQAAQQAFAITDSNAPAVAAICTRLDGIPLALELAAARVRSLPVEKIAERLSDRFRLLTGGSRTALPRQQTLRALIDWSYDLLVDEERALLRRLAVFAGGFTLEAVEVLGAGAQADEAMVLDLLARLVEKSLVALEAQGERYRLLETVRQYAQEHLLESGEADDARARHFEFYLALAERARPELVGADQAVWLARLDVERENLMAAHAWCDEAPQGGPLGLRLVSALRRYWIVRGLLGLGHRVTLEALQRPTAQARDAARCRALFDAGQIGSWMGRYAEARDYLQQSISIARELGDASSVAGALQPLALATLGLGDVAAARQYLEEALELEREGGDQREVAAVLNALAQIHRAQGELDAAQPLYENALAIGRTLHDREIIAIGLLNLAMVAIGRGAAQDACAMLLEVEAIAEALGWRPAGQSVLDVCAGLAATSAQWERAARFFGAAEAQMGETGLYRDPADEAFLLPLIAQTRATIGPAVFAAADAAGRALTYEDAMGEARAWLTARAAAADALPPGRTATG
jgi:predicted ATPase/class 3 adenylate cyclase